MMRVLPSLLVCIGLGLSLLGTGCKEQMLTGYYDRERFLDTCAWRKPVAENYQPDPVYMDSLVNYADSFEVVLVLGTWCGDSEKWVSRYFNMQPELPQRGMTIVAVDTAKEDSLGFLKAYEVDSVPTFIFLDGERELGRLVEEPRKTGWFKRNLAQHLWLIFRRAGHVRKRSRGIAWRAQPEQSEQ